MGFNSISPILSAEGVSHVTANPSYTLGTRVIKDGNEYVYVYNAGAAQITVGHGCYINSANSNYSVSVTNAASQVGRLVGICNHSTITTATYGFVMTRGCSIIAADGTETSFAAGNTFTVGVDGGFVAMTGATYSTGTPYGYTISTCQTAGTTTPGKAWMWTYH